ncbi:MAG: hypothetical protein O3A95_05700 [Planctomycetota bacterium]|nr:hypothetical protein [Planctomycetota bacterium]MDA1113781.1 hypothetical protein [Planctomycetota bacterium]
MILGIAFALMQEAGHLASFVQPSGSLLDARTFADFEGDGDLDLFQAVLASNGKRYIDVHLQKDGHAFSAAPDVHLEMSDQLVAWNVGDFLHEEGEKGAEILLFASRGVYLRKHSGRLLRLNQDPVSMLLDMPSSQDLPLWDPVADIDGDGKPEVVVATGNGYRILDDDGKTLGDIPVGATEDIAPVAAGNYLGGLVRTKIGSQELGSLFVPNEDLGVISRPPALFTANYMPSPVWADVNGDGLQDLTYLRDANLSLFMQNEDGTFPSEASQVIELPDNGESDFEQVDWMDLGGGPADDLLFVRSSSDYLSQARPWQVRFYLDPAQKEDLEYSDAFLKVNSTFLWVFAMDLNADGRKDICLSNWKLDLGLLGQSAPEVQHDISGFLDEEGSWASRPAFVWSRTYKVEDFDSFVSLDSFQSDLTGDGQPDFLERAISGNLEVRRFSGNGSQVTVNDDVVAEIPIQALQATIEVQDLNGDGIGDFVIQRDGNLEIHLSYLR